MDTPNLSSDQLSLEQKVDLILKTVIRTSTEIAELKNENNYLKEKIIKMEKNMDYLESQLMQNEIFFYGITNDDIELEVLNVINNIIILPFKVTMDHIQNVKEIGKGEKRDILVKFVSLKTRNAILKNAKNLRNTKYAVAPRFTRKVMEERQLLKPYLLSAKNLGHEAKLINNTICINKKIYNLEQCKSLKMEKIETNKERIQGENEASTSTTFQVTGTGRKTRANSKTIQGSK